MKFKVREYEIDCRTSESLSTILNSIQSMSKFGNEATTVKVQKLCQNSEMKQICPAPTCEESHLDELNEREHNTPELVSH